MNLFLQYLSHVPYSQFIHFLDLVWNYLHPGSHGAPRLVTCTIEQGCKTYIQWGVTRIPTVVHGLGHAVSCVPKGAAHTAAQEVCK